MRIIKYRCWYRGHMYDRLNLYIEPDYTGVEIIKGRGNNIHTDTVKAKLMQFTGLLDKNEKEIFEGDILKESDNELIFAVKYDTENGGHLMPKEYDEEYICLIGAIPTHVEIIGDIYSNPELLK